MTRRSKREIERALDDLDSHGDGGRIRVVRENEAGDRVPIDDVGRPVTDADLVLVHPAEAEGF